jgi:uncharacterized membrane protein
MTPLIVLIGTFLAGLAGNKLFAGGRLSSSLLGRIALAAMLVVTGVAHFTSTDLMVAMMPDFVPLKREMVYFTGVCEIAGAAGLLWNKTSRLAAIMLVIFFVAVLPANIAGSFKRVELGGMEYGPVYLWFRVPFQIFLIWWTWYFGIRKDKPAAATVIKEE